MKNPDRSRIARLFVEEGEDLLRAILAEDRMPAPRPELLATQARLITQRVEREYTAEQIEQLAACEERAIRAAFHLTVGADFRKIIAPMRPS